MDNARRATDDGSRERIRARHLFELPLRRFVRIGRMVPDQAYADVLRGIGANSIARRLASYCYTNAWRVSDTACTSAAPVGLYDKLCTPPTYSEWYHVCKRRIARASLWPSCNSDCIHAHWQDADIVVVLPCTVDSVRAEVSAGCMSRIDRLP